MMLNRTCEHCRETYRTHESVRKRFCSQKCCGLANQKRLDMTCQQCGMAFWAHASVANRRKFCSQSCSTTFRNLTDANPSYHRDITGDKNPMFGKPGMAGEKYPMFGRKRELNPGWHGGRWTRRDGYIVTIAPDDHPNPSDIKPGGTKYILEHRLVMERKLGRYLLPTEVVHHLDENPSNNHPNNLEVLESQSSHCKTHNFGAKRKKRS